MIKSETGLWRRQAAEALPLAAMIVVECGDVGTSLLLKAAVNKGMSNFVYMTYYNILGVCILLPHFIFHSYRNSRPPLTWNVLFRCCILGLIGKSSALFTFIGLSYSSPTLQAAIGNLVPIFTFLLALILRMESLEMKRPSTIAKLLGTVVTVAGAFIVTLYKGPLIISGGTSSSPSLLHQQLLKQSSNWILGGVILAASTIFTAAWFVLQASTVKMYPDQTTVIFYMLSFGTFMFTSVSLFVERNPSAWKLSPDVGLVAVLYSAIVGTAIRFSIITWCLRKKGPLYVAMFGPLAMIIAEIGGFLFLGERIYLGSVIGAAIIAFGFYTVMWGKSKESNPLMDSGSSNVESPSLNTHLLQNS